MVVTNPGSESIYTAAELLKSQNTLLVDLLLAIKNFIVVHADSLPEKYQPKSIIESRFTSAEDAFEKGIVSCGAIANISTAMLRHIGYRVKLIHGESQNSVDHAWISVFDPKINTWVEYDLTRDDSTIPSTHIKKAEVDSWEEIRDQIIKDHETMRERRIERGLIKE